VLGGPLDTFCCVVGDALAYGFGIDCGGKDGGETVSGRMTTGSGTGAAAGVATATPPCVAPSTGSGAGGAT